MTRFSSSTTTRRRSEERRVGKECRYARATSRRRRHTRFSRDWSSDVCSSDLRDNGLQSLSLPEFGFDGGDTEPRGTWQAEALKTIVTDPAVDYVTFTAHQFDDQVFEFYYNSEKIGRASCRERV